MASPAVRIEHHCHSCLSRAALAIANNGNRERMPYPTRMRAVDLPQRQSLEVYTFLIVPSLSDECQTD